MNPNNSLINNTAAGADYVGFSFEMDDFILDHQREQAPPECQARMPTLQQLRAAPVGTFSGNRAHSLPHAGLWMSRFWDPWGPTSVMRNFTAYKIYGVEYPHDLGRSACVMSYNFGNVRIENLVCADVIRALFQREGAAIINAMFVGYTNNIGTGRNPRLPASAISEYGECDH